MSTKLLVYDIEATGVLYYRNCIHQLSGMVVIDGVVQETFDFRIRPHEQAIVEDQALEVSGVTREQVMQYAHRTEQFSKFKALLQKHIDPYNSTDRFFLVGFNNSWFDDAFLRNFFILESDDGFNAWFWPNSIDVMVLASYYLMPDRAKMPSFKLKRVAIWLGIAVDETKLHEALYDVYLTYEIYKKVKGKTIDDW